LLFKGTQKQGSHDRLAARYQGGGVSRCGIEDDLALARLYDGVLA
jgi:hypothetical protein